MYPTKKQLQSLMSERPPVVESRTMGRYKPGYLTEERNFNKPGEVKLPGRDFDPEGWRALQKKGYKFESGYKLIKPDGTVELRLPCKDSKCYD